MPLTSRSPGRSRVMRFLEDLATSCDVGSKNEACKGANKTGEERPNSRICGHGPTFVPVMSPVATSAPVVRWLFGI